MATIGSLASPGIGSGIDVNGIISQLMAVESRPIVNLQRAEGRLQAKLSGIGQLQGLVSSFKDALSALTKSDAYTQTLATSSDPTAVAATSSSSATAGAYAISVQALAASQTLVSASGLFTASTDVVGTGTLTLRLGTFSAGQTVFTPKTGSADVTISIGATENTLQGVRDKINAAKAGVVASIVTDVNGARLSLTSSATGAENGFRLTVVESGAPGLGRLGFNPPGAVNQMTLAQSAANSVATVNGISVTSTDNTLTSAIPGVTLSLNKVTTAPVTVTVSNNLDAVKAMLSKLASAYNDVNKFLSDQTRYDPQAKQGALFQGDSTIVRLQNRVRSLVAESSTASSTFTSLSAIGLEMQKDGSLKVNATKLDAAVKNLPELTKALSQASGGAPGSTGMATKLAEWADGLISATTGALPSQTKSLQKSLTANGKQQASLSDRLAATEQRLRAQYGALDTTVSRYKALNNYVTQQFYTTKPTT